MFGSRSLCKLFTLQTQHLLSSCSAWLHISPLRSFLNTSCTAIREKRSRRRRSSALFIPSDYQSLSLLLPRLGRKDSAARPAICQSGPGGYAWLCPGRTACRRAAVDERKRYANQRLICGGTQARPARRFHYSSLARLIMIKLMPADRF